jgi:hypothetical protein
MALKRFRNSATPSGVGRHVTTAEEQFGIMKDE